MLAELRQRLQAMQRPPGIDDDHGVLPLGLPAVDAALGGGLARGALHEIAAPSEPHVAAATRFALALALASLTAAASRKNILWIAEDMALIESGAPYGPGLAQFGLPPEQLLTVAVAHRRDLLWAMEESLRCRSVSAAIGEMRHGELDPVALRRLSLAAATHGALALLLRASPAEDASTAATRWIVGAAPSDFSTVADDTMPTGEPLEPGPPRLAAHLIRNRRGPGGSWILQWSDNDERFTRATPAEPLAAPPPDRPGRQVA